MRLLPVVLVAALCVAVTGSCDRTPKAVSQALRTPPAVELLLALKGGQGGGPFGARLNYEVHAPTGVLPMRLADPKHPEGAMVELEHATLNIKPFVCPPKLDKIAQQCSAKGCYTLCVRDSRGIHVGDFEVNSHGVLVLKPDTHDTTGVEIERISTVERTVYFAYEKLPSGKRGPSVLALEYVPADSNGSASVSGDDRWQYSFSSPDGRLIVFKPQGLSPMADQLARIAENQARSLAASYEDEMRDRMSGWILGRASGSSAGGACSTGGG